MSDESFDVGGFLRNDDETSAVPEDVSEDEEQGMVTIGDFSKPPQVPERPIPTLKPLSIGEFEAAVLAKSAPAAKPKAKKKPPKKSRHPKRPHYIAMDPAQQPMIDFLSKPDHGPVKRTAWLAQLCIPPIGIDQSYEVSRDAKMVTVSEIQSAVVEWAKSEDLGPYHLQVGGVYLTFTRCVPASVIELNKPFETLQLVLQGQDLLYEAQNQFAEYGLVLNLSTTE
jgi:hypothetical protein